jgi:copper chaperone CopZ
MLMFQDPPQPSTMTPDYPPRSARGVMAKQVEGSMEKEFVLLSSTMTCERCEEEIEEALAEVTGVVTVSACHTQGTITIGAFKCPCDIDCCQTCSCGPRSRSTLRCCQCGASKYIEAVRKIGHSAWCQTRAQPSKQSGLPELKYRYPNVNACLALAAGLAAGLLGFCLKAYLVQLQRGT